MGIGVVQTVDIAEDYQRIRVAYKSDAGGKCIVITELDLVEGDTVVLVYDRQAAHTEQGGEGVFGILMGGGVVHDVTGQQHLSHRMTEHGKEMLVYTHKVALTDCRHCLLFLGGGGAVIQTQLGNACADSSRGDQDYLLTHIAKVGKHAAKCLYAAEVHLEIVVGESGGSNLDDYALSILYNVHFILPVFNYVKILRNFKKSIPFF